MKKNSTLFNIIIITISSLALMGCSLNPMPELSESESEAVSEYAVGMLMKYDKKHATRYMDDADLTKELSRLQTLADNKVNSEVYSLTTKAENQKEKEEKQQALDETPVVSAGEGIANSSLYVEDFYGLEGFSIRYVGFKCVDQYPDSSSDTFYFSMTPTTGKKLLVLEFNATNISSDVKELDMLSKDASFRISINGESEKYALSTLLLNDLATYKGSILGGQSETLVIVTEVEEEISKNITSVAVKMESASENATIQLN